MEAVACKDWLLLSIMMTGDGDWLQRLDHHHCHFDDVPVDDGDVNSMTPILMLMMWTKVGVDRLQGEVASTFGRGGWVVGEQGDLIKHIHQHTSIR